MRSSSDASTATSPPPFSPFSSQRSAAGSEMTSDDPGDLGAFTGVFRALTLLQNTSFVSAQPTPRAAAQEHLVSESESDAEWARQQTTVWAQGSIASYLSPPASSRSPPAVSDGEASDDTEAEEELPSLGALDSALVFLAQERARHAAAQPDPRAQPTSDRERRSVGEPRRKRRRRRRSGAARRGEENDEDEDDREGRTETIVPTPEAISSAEGSTSDRAVIRAPATTPARRPRTAITRQLKTLPQLSTEPTTESTENPSQALRLRQLANKLLPIYPDEHASISLVMRNIKEPAKAGGLVDPRGPEATPTDAIVHVFVDYSNILIGFLSFLKRHPELYHRRQFRDKPKLSHEALSLLLERGRPVSRRELAASKPLYQSMDNIYQLGFDVHLFLRVRDEGDDIPSPVRGHRNSNSFGGSTDSDRSPYSANGNGIAGLVVPPPRTKYREQGVDECLQLKLYQSVVAHDPPPPGATIVLATGDGASGQFNADGFPGTVKTALRKGWNVELYSWENGLSGAWNEFLTGERYRGRFTVRGLEKFASDLIAVD